jgi:hypothetical protein
LETLATEPSTYKVRRAHRLISNDLILILPKLMIARRIKHSKYLFTRHMWCQVAIHAKMASKTGIEDVHRSPPRVIIIGAGFYGLAAAKVTQSSSQLPYILLINAVQTLLEVEPSASLTIIDECTHVGGVWSYP